MKSAPQRIASKTVTCHESTMSRSNTNQQFLPWIISVFCLIGYSQCETEPVLLVNHAAAYGTPIKLSCSDKADSVKWSFYNASTRDEIIIFNTEINGLHKDTFSIDKPVKGYFNLLFNASEKTAGLYVCEGEITGAGRIGAPAQVIVLDAKPTCSVVKEPESLKLECHIGYTGYWSPFIEWSTVTGTLEPDTLVTLKNNVTLRNNVTSTATVKFQGTDPPESSIPTCKVKFRLQNFPGVKGNPNNLPDYSNTCKPTLPQKGKDVQGSTQSPPPPSTPSSSLIVHNVHNPCLCFCLVTLAFIGMLNKWLWQ